MKAKATGGVETLTQKRDELRVQAHLFGVEMKDQWEKLEKDWNVLKTSFQKEEPKIKEAFENVGHVVEPLIEELHTAYDRIKSELRRINTH